MLYVNFFSPMPPHVHIDFVVPPPGCGRSVTDFWGWGAHRAQLRCSDDVSDVDMYERGVPGGALNLNSTSYSDQTRYGDLSLQGRTSTAEPGIESGSSWLVVRSPDHQATRLVICEMYCVVSKQPHTVAKLIYESEWVCWLRYDTQDRVNSVKNDRSF
jgi:hypothetical protein